MKLRCASRRTRRLLAVGLCALLVVGVGEAGIRAAGLRPGPGNLWDWVTGTLLHRGGGQVQAAPQQRWESDPAPADPVRKGNDVVPASLRQRYPLRPEPPVPAPAPNPARVEAAPPAQIRGFDPATSVEQLGSRTANTRVYDNSDGTQTTVVSTAALNFRTRDGGWDQIDTRLVPVEGGWHNAAGPVDISVAGRADAAPLARLDLGTQELSYALAGAAAVAGTVSGGAVVYPNARPSTDVELAVGYGALKETLVLRDPGAPREFAFPLTLRGLTAAPVSGGAIALLDPSGQLRATIPAGSMTDRAGASSSGVRYELSVENGQSMLRVTLDRAWLADPARAYPVRVDPSVDFAGPDSTMESFTNTSHAGGTELRVGDTPFGPAATYLKFTNLVNQLKFHTIYGVQLSIVSYNAPSCSPRPMSVHAVTQDWTAGDGFGYPGPAVGPALATQSFAYGFIPTGATQSPCPAGQALFDLGRGGRDVVQWWASGGSNYGLSLRASDSDPLSWKAIAGAGTANPPTLYVTHSPYNADYTIPNPVPNPPVLQNQAGKVKVTVTNKGAEAWSPSAYYLAYRAYDVSTHTLVAQQRSGSLPATLARGAQATIDATINPLPPGRYYLDFTMVRSGGPVFTDEQVPPARMVLEVIDIPPVLQELYPPNGYQAPTLTPQLWARAVDIDAPPASTLRFSFRICELVGTTQSNCLGSGDQTSQAWTVPAGKLAWSKSYQWQATVKDGTNVVTSDWVNLLTSVPQPEVTSHIAGAPYGTQGREFDPQVGNYSTVAVDASVANAGPSLGLVRTYNSLDPRRDLAFGAGWTSEFDMRVTPDDDGSGNAVVTYPDGQQVRYGRNPDGTFAAPQGRVATLTLSGSTYTMADREGMSYQFTSTGRLARIADGNQRALVMTYDSGGKLTKATVSNSQTNTAGRSLTFTWTGAHVTSVKTDPVNGSALTWTYTYAGDLLTQACGPTNACTTYSYASGSHYRSAVIDSAPQSYWRLGESQGTAAGSEIAVNLGKDAGTYRNITLGTPGPAGTGGNTAVSFNGTSSEVDLPKGLLKRSRDAAVELWFRVSASQTGGPLIGYQDADLANTSTVGAPLLYVGTDGKLRGQFRGASIAPITSVSTVNNNVWHHAVLSVLGSTQTLWLDGAKVGTLAAAVDHNALTFNQIGAAYATSPGSWPAWGTTSRRFFSGAIDDVAIYNSPLGQPAVTAHYRYGTQAADQLSKATLPSGRVASEVSYNTALDRVNEYTDSNGGTWRVGAPAVYGGDDDLRRSVTVLDPAGRPYFYEYDALASRLLRTGTPSGLGTREEDLPGYRPPSPSPTPTPSPSATCTSPDPGDPTFCTILPGDSSAPQFIRQPLDGMAVRSFTYDDRGFQSSVVNENGTATSFVYDGRGNVTAQTTCRTATQCFTQYLTYPATATNPLDPRNDLPVETRDGRSANATDNTYRTAYTYSPTGNLLTQTNPDGGVVRHTYTTGAEQAVGGGATPPGLLASTTDVRNAVTQYAYFANGDLARMTDPSGLVVNYTYDPLGRRLTETEVSDSFPAGVVTTYAYDALSRVISTVDPASTDAASGSRHQRSTEQAFDVDGNLTMLTVRDLLGGDSARVTTYAYDDHGRPNQVTDAEGNVTTFSYDAFGNKVGMVDSNGNQYRYAYTARNALSEVRLRDWNGDPPGVPAGTTVDGYLVVDSYAYDLAGRMVRHTDAMGHRIEYGYYLDDLLATVTLKNFHNPDGSTRDYVVTNNTYDGAGNLIKEIAGNGTRTTQYTVTTVGQIATSTTNPGGVNRRTAYTYDLAGDVLTVTRSGNASNVPWAVPVTSSTVTNQYDSSGNLIKETVGTGSDALVTTYGYDQRGLQISTTSPRGNVSGADPAAFTTSHTYDELGQQTTVTAPPVAVESDGNAAQTSRPVVKVGYDTFGEAMNTVDAAGNSQHTTFDKLGRPVTVNFPPYIPPGSMTTILPTTTATYDGLGNTTQLTDVRGNVTRYTYDRMNRVVTRDDPASTNDERALWRYTYTRTGDVLSVTGPTGARAETTYDDLDRSITLTTVERQPTLDNLTSRYTYDDASDLLTSTSPTGASTTMAYDGLGQLIKATNPNGVAVQYGYDYTGAPVRLTDGLGRTDRTDYDAFGRVATQSDLSPSGTTLRTVSYAVDQDGNVLATSDALGGITMFSYDGLDHLTAQWEQTSSSHGITTSFGYDSAGRRTRYTDGRGNATIYTYNSLGLPQSVIEPSTPAQPGAADRTWTASYDAAGAPVKLQAPGSVLRQRTYDAAGRLTLETGSGAAATSDRRFSYDLAGHVLTSATPTGTDTFSYNDRDALLSATGASGNSSFAYDADGLMLSRTDRAGTTRFTYDKGRLSTVVDAITGTSQQLGYDGAGQASTVDYGSGRVRTYGYDDFGRIASDAVRNSANAVVASETYSFDAEDRMIRKVTTGTAGAGDNAYGYDMAGRLTSWTAGATTVNYAWDDSGNRIANGTKTATYDARDRLVSDSDYTYSYTPRGTIASRTSSGFSEQFSFDAFDRLVAQGGQTYSYDSLDRVVQRGPTSFGYAGLSDEPISDGVENYARGLGDELLAVSEGQQKRLVLSDAHGDVTGDFDPANTTLTNLDDSRAFSPFGQTIASSGANQANLGFQGDYTDPQTGEVDMGARWYDPGSGTFLSQDPSQYSNGPSILANPYTYGSGDPLDNADPDGEWPHCGWCHKAWHKAAHTVKSVYHSVRHGFQWGIHAFGTGLSFGWSALKWTGRQLGHGAGWLYEHGKSIVQSAAHAVSAGFHWVGHKASSAWHHVADLGRHAVRWVRDRADDVRRAAVAAAHRVTEAAHAAVRFAVEHNPLPAIKAALKPIYSTMTHIVSAAAHLPAAVVSTVRNVVHDAARTVQAVYHAAVEAAGTVVDAVSTAARAVSEFAQAALPMVAGIAVGFAAGLGCTLVTGAAPACVVAGFAAGGAVSSMLSCPPGRSIASCAVKGAMAGAIGGAVFVATGGVGAGVSGGIVSGALSSAAQSEAAQLAETGRIDGRSVAISAIGGGIAGGIGGAFEGGAAEGATEGEAGPACTNSFAEDTRVVLADGGTKAIRDVRVGDVVMATDPTSGRTEPHTVTETIVGRGLKVLVQLTVDGPQATDSTIVATSGHPFHTLDRGWQNAEQLRPGTRLDTGDGATATVVATREWTALAQVRNLTVDGLHTFYVLLGTTPVLVHNCNGEDLNHNQVRNRIEVHVMSLHGYGTPAEGTKFAEGLGPDQLFEGLVNRLDNDNATLTPSPTGNHEHILDWPEAGSNGENRVRVMMSPQGELGSMWPVP